VYSDLQYKITDRLTARAGLRYTKDSGDLNNFRAILTDLNGNPLFNIIPGSDDLGATTSRDFDDDDISGKIGLDYELAADMMVYASYSRGYRGASFNAQAIFSPAELTIADPETLDAVEVGFKSELAGASSPQRCRILVRLQGPAVHRHRSRHDIAALINLPESEIIGGELELQWLPSRT
jgi:iron complex outermembrane receptor protein